MFGLTASKPDLIVHSAKPLNAEPSLDRLRSAFITGVADFYVRCHGDTPDLAAETHRVLVTGQVTRPLTLSLADLQTRFETRSVTAVMQCAGNRRADLQQVRPTTGDPWAPGAIGNAVWTGVALADVLRDAGADMGPDRHVAFEAADVADNDDASNAPFGVSIPMSKALCPDVLLAWAMNGEALSKEHGAPLRVVVPGFAGVRSAKWLTSITVQDAPSVAFQQAHDYLLFPADLRKDTQDETRGVPITEMPLNSAVCEPQPGATLPAGKTTVRGYSIATDRAITRIDISSNGGRDWVQAAIEDHGNARWSWTFWHATVTLPPGDHEIAVRAWDAAGQTQPASVDDVWNFKGYLCNAWHRVRVSVT